MSIWLTNAIYISVCRLDIALCLITLHKGPIDLRMDLNISNSKNACVMNFLINVYNQTLINSLINVHNQTLRSS